MKDQDGSLMFLKTHKSLTRKQRAALESAQPSELPALAESMGMKVMTGINIRPRERIDLLPTLTLILEEQRKTNQLLTLLIDALSEDDDPDAEPLTYMDGTPIG